MSAEAESGIREPARRNSSFAPPVRLVPQPERAPARFHHALRRRPRSAAIFAPSYRTGLGIESRKTWTAVSYARKIPKRIKFNRNLIPVANSSQSIELTKTALRYI
jgi:hypothetical protein